MKWKINPGYLMSLTPGLFLYYATDYDFGSRVSVVLAMQNGQYLNDEEEIVANAFIRECENNVITLSGGFLEA